MTPEEFSKLPPALQQALSEVGLPARFLDAKAPIPGEKPYTQVGAASLKGEAVSPKLGKNTMGATIGMQGGDSTDTFIAYAPAGSYSKTDMSPSVVRAHEIEHALSAQGLGSGAALNSLWDKLTEADKDYRVGRGSVVGRLIKHAPYLEKNWGLDPTAVKSGYFSKEVLDRKDARNFLYEQLATLSALEQLKNKKLTEDPYVRENIFRTPAERETYDALTGLRQTRLDAKDLPPHTRQPEKMKATLLERIRSTNWFAQGGLVDKAAPEAYRSKLI